MKFVISINLLCALLLLSVPSWTQIDESVVVKKRIAVKTIIVDSLTIIPESVILLKPNGDTLHHSLYEILNNRVELKDPSLFDTLFVGYQTLGVDLGRNFFKLDSVALAESDDVIKTGLQYTVKNKNKNVFDNNALSYDGSFSRGFSIGNRQSLNLNSEFNLQMAGIIGDDIEIIAALTDANIPIQAEGNTHQINEFDRVFIQLKKDQHILNAGDLEIENPNSYFSRYKKKLKGLNYSDNFNFKNKKQLSSSVAYAISKGKFARNTLKTLEGNQGPYKLIGSGGERFLIVLSGSEKVYLDGMPLKRGSEYDYIIDYNLAEIRFTFNRLITAESRIIVEFEYVDQNYLRSLQTVNNSWKSSTTESYFNIYNEQDSKTSLGNITLDSTDISLLNGSGDELLDASRSGVRTVSTADQIDVVLYKKAFNPEINDSILVYSNSPDSARYSAYFSDVGEYNGSYSIKELTTINGRVYEYVGKGNGRYEPIIKLQAPERQQLFTFGHRQKISKHTDFHAELSLSNKDLNRFSSLDDEDNLGSALFTHFNTARNLNGKEDSLNPSKLFFDLKYEYAGENFTALNPYRSTEFIRDWNLNGQEEKSHEHLVHSEIGLQSKTLKIAYGFSGFYKTGMFDGSKHRPLIHWKNNRSEIRMEGDFLWTKSHDEKSLYFRPKIELNRKIPLFNDGLIGFSFNQEKNRKFNSLSDSLKQNSFYFNNYRLHFKAGGKTKFPFQFYVNYREDYKASAEDFISNFNSLDAGLKGSWALATISNLNYNVTFRQFQVDSLFSDQNIRGSNTLLGKLSHKLDYLNGFLKSTTQVDINTGQEAKTEFVFIELTNPGEGNYIWLDSNDDGIRQKGEFEAAPFSDEANFIKIVQYNNEFIRVNNSSFNNTLNLQLKSLFGKKNRSTWTSLLSRISMNGNFRYIRKTQDSQQKSFNLPFISSVPDTSIVAQNTARRLNFYFNKLDPVYDIQLSHNFNKNRNLQLDGLIQFGSMENSVRSRYSFKTNFDLVIMGSFGQQFYEAALYPTKNYAFDFHEVTSELKYRPSRKIGIQLKYAFVEKGNNEGLEEKLNGNELEAKFTIRKWYDFNIQFSLAYARYNYSGDSNTSIELSMMEGLKNGNNYLWSLNFTRKMSSNIDLSFRYDGRKTGDQKPIHVANMQAKARF